MTEQYIKKMADNLRLQQAEYKKMLEYAEDKRKALVSADMTTLENIINQEEALIKQIGSLELQRMEIQTAMAQRLNLPPEELNWEGLKQILNDKDKALISHNTEELRKVISQLSDVNSINQNLLDQSLKLVKMSINTMSGETEKTYTKTPVQQKKKEGKLFDIKA